MAKLQLRRIGLKTVFSLAVPLALCYATAAVMSIRPNTRGIDIATGQRLFSVHCNSCHFVKAGFPAHHGPNLHEIGKTAASRRPNQSAAEYILESILDPSAFVAPTGRPGMPPNLAAELAPNEIRNIVGFLASCGEFPDYDAIGKLEISDRRKSGNLEPKTIRLEDMQLAENVLRQKGSCLQCHSLYAEPEGAVFAPGLFGVGMNDLQGISDSLKNPNKEIKPRYKGVRVTLKNGQVVSGQLISRNEEQLVLSIRNEQNGLAWREIPLVEIEVEDGELQILESASSIMPDGFGETLSPEEISAVINLIRQLN